MIILCEEKEKKVWRAVYQCIFWTICKQKNQRVFEIEEAGSSTKMLFPLESSVMG